MSGCRSTRTLTNWLGYELELVLGTRWFGYELVVGTSWSWYKLVLGTSWLGYELAWYDLVRVRVDWKPLYVMADFFVIIHRRRRSLLHFECARASFCDFELYSSCILLLSSNIDDERPKARKSSQSKIIFISLNK